MREEYIVAIEVALTVMAGIILFIRTSLVPVPRKEMVLAIVMGAAVAILSIVVRTRAKGR